MPVTTKCLDVFPLYIRSLIKYSTMPRQTHLIILLHGGRSELHQSRSTRKALEASTSPDTAHIQNIKEHYPVRQQSSCWREYKFTQLCVEWFPSHKSLFLTYQWINWVLLNEFSQKAGPVYLEYLHNYTICITVLARPENINYSSISTSWKGYYEMTTQPLSPQQPQNKCLPHNRQVSRLTYIKNLWCSNPCKMWLETKMSQTQAIHVHPATTRKKGLHCCKSLTLAASNNNEKEQPDYIWEDPEGSFR